MSGEPPHLPSLPSGFGTDSSYPPMPGSSRVTASQPKPPVTSAAKTYRPVAPPLPPVPAGALQQEQLRLHHQPAAYPSSISSHPTPISSDLRPGQYVHATSPPQFQNQFVGGFAPPDRQSARTPSGSRPLPSMPTAPSPQGRMAHQPPPSSMSQSQSLASNMQAMSIQHHQPQTNVISARRASANDAYAPPPAALPTSGPPSLSAPLPDLVSLASQRDRARDEKQRVSWSKQVLKYVERNFSDSTKISEPSLVKWTDEAISIIIRSASSPRPEPEALYLRGDLQASGAFPTYLGKNLKEAFNDFELSARMGWPPSWFRIGRDYEVLGDLNRAKEAYDRGVHAGDVGCVYRMGMANLLGQLEIPVNHTIALVLLCDAADKADLDTPQPAYIYGMLLAGEFSHVSIPSHLLQPSEGATSLEDDARRRIQRAAYLNFAPAQYKCGWLYEYAQLHCAFDPLLSVQYYSLASQGGETEADMALSKWFLCGAEGYFEKNERLAYTFADKAARKGLASAEFALGYYHEVGVGTERNVNIARKWYNKAAAKGNADAVERLQALQSPQALGLSRQQHEAVMDDKLVRKRTMAKMLSDREGRTSTSSNVSHDTTSPRRFSHALPSGTNNYPRVQSTTTAQPAGGNSNNLELSRKKTMKMVEETAAGRRRPNYGFEGRPGAPPPLPPAPMQGANAVAPTHQPPPPQPPMSASQPYTHPRVSSGTHPSHTAGRHGTGYTLHDASQPTNAPAPAPAPPQIHAPSSNTSTQVTSSSNASSDDANKKAYNTFAEMGFAPQKVSKKDECVVC